jgi:periplasmic divalent cation tolerance protein
MQDCVELDILTVTTTVGSASDARQLARRILDLKLAACVQIEEGLVSLYPWQGRLCEEAEVRLVIKTLPGCEAPLQALFAQHHPYELPQFVAIRMTPSEAYGRWVRESIALPGAAVS